MEEEVIDISTALDLMGGFGRLQMIATFALALTRNSGDFPYYCFAYMTLGQLYLCRYDSSEPFSTCSTETDICPALANGTPIEFKVDTSYEYYLDNWYVQMNLMCSSEVRTNFLIIAYTISFGVAGFLFFPLPEIYGRRITVLITFAFSLIAQYILAFSPVYYVKILGFVMLGLCQMKNTLGYVWSSELVPTRNNVAVNASISSLDQLTPGIACFYFLYVSRDIVPLLIGVTVLGTLGFVLDALILPESPIWLLNQGRTKDAIQVLNYIGRFNGVKTQLPETTLFKETVYYGPADGETTVD